MSIARRVTVRRLLGTGAAALALTAAASGSAWATGTPGGDGWGKKSYVPGEGAGTATETDRCEFSLDGVNFADWVKLDDQNLKPTEDGKVHIKVRAASDATTCTVSLASYLAHGPTFATSGEQVFVDFDTVTVKPGATDSLDIAVPDAGCYAQIDLYRGKVKFDGKLDAKDGFEHGDVPKGPDRPVIKDKLIAAWNGGTKDCTTEEQPPAGENPPTEEQPPADENPPAEEQPPGDTPESDSPEPTPSDSTPAAPTPNGGGGDLAETGGGNTIPLALGAAGLLAAGGAIFVVTRRRGAGRTDA
ncbi:LPXTG cell wall anchor domain-containing protein [Streptomyces ipomoeae]|uniref:LPXTG cell wall anchor domain protein n=1 Tax=Streptomyces ipomoeae 91-03 TaxID=698759 RepID=L1KQ93_9ACTN|nr:LPXTG cell wall anchor domain-containing protein [Streptomyces ipomoeae]EKX62966.1 LPXTG cell wall anchor domain protein [Streptomyces ipomoeae 91-03]MDX2700771.1 LPXTG cell wall anchor domain-containing protein [Streptomyces ipomoeae]MDX2846424.1 LPXTG cell wall anchor domain-containing protein [Streptomyces ipomoeae]